MAQASATFDSIRSDLSRRQYAPVYLLHGEEGYYIDALVDEFDKILGDDEKAFNQNTLYAPDVEPAAVSELCHRMPMMADRQVVILKEAQAVPAAKLNKLAAYAGSPSPTTILVICCRGAEAKAKDLIKAINSAKGVVFESKKLKDYQVPAAIAGYIKNKGLTAEQKSLEMLCEFIGNDLSRLHNEIDKLAGILGPGAAVTPEAIERNIGISKEYNTFELVDALAVKDAAKVFRIIAYFRSNPKSAPLVMVTTNVFNFFADLLVAYYSPDRGDSALMALFKLRHPLQLRRYREGMARYNPFQLIEIISAIRDFDTKSKGVGSRQNEHRLFHDLMYHILTAPGNIRR